MQTNITKSPIFATALSAAAVLTALGCPLMASRVEAAPTFITTAQGAGADLNVRGGGGFGSSNFGDHDVLRVRNSKDLGNARKTYLRFDLASLPVAIAKATDATVGLQIAPAEGKSAPDKIWTFQVYGLKNGATGEDWSEKTATWNNAPTNDAKSALALTDDATPLGTFTLAGTGEVGNSVAFSSPQLLKFLQSDTNGEVTLII